MKTLGVEFGVYVPTALWEDPVSAGFQMALLDKAGGYTAIPAFGAWLTPEGAVVNESIVIVRARGEKFDYAAQSHIQRAFVAFGEALFAKGEKAVYMERNGEAWIAESAGQTTPAVLSHKPGAR